MDREGLVGVKDIVITSSHRPSRRVRSFINDLAGAIARAARINRGKKSLEELEGLMRLKGYRILIVVNTWKANPGRVDIYVRRGKGLVRVGYLVVRHVKLSREQNVPGCGMRAPRIDSSRCTSQLCRDVEGILEAVLVVEEGGAGGSVGGDVVHIESKGDIVYIWFSKDGKICGPRIGVRSAFRASEAPPQGGD